MIPKVCAMAMLLAFLGVILTELGFKGKRLFGALGIVALLFSVGEGIGALLSEVTELTEAAGISEAARSAAKIVGVGYVFGICSDICEELGERGIASALSAAGRVEIVALVLPYISKIIDFGLELIK